MSEPLGIASYVTTYSVRKPYLTAAEYQGAPTAVDAGNLVQGGTEQANLYELNNVIARASSRADTICFGTEGCLAASTDMDGPDRFRIDRYGVIKMPLRFFPVLQVNSISIGETTSTMQAMTATQANNLVIKRRGLEIPAGSLANGRIIPGGPIGGFGIGAHPLVQVTYVNGYPTATLAATANAEATTIDIDDGTGIYPGTSLMMYDDYPGGEAITVGPSYVLGALTLPLVAPLQFKHSAGVSVSALPADVKQAVIHLTSALILTRGTATIQAGQLKSAPTTKNATAVGAQNHFDAAEKLLNDFRRVR
jgi:hypothetical protein